jgi:hypothetical protein
MRMTLFSLFAAVAMLTSCDAILNPGIYHAHKVSVTLTGSYSPNYDPSEHPSFSQIQYQYNVFIQKAYDSTGVIQGIATVCSNSVPANGCSVLFTDGIPLDEAFIILAASGTGSCQVVSDHYTGPMSSNLDLVQKIVRFSDLEAGTSHVEKLPFAGADLVVTANFTLY